MNKRNYENYFKSKKHVIKKELVNTYIKRNNKYLLSNGYGIVMVNEIPNNFIEQTKYGITLSMQFNKWYVDCQNYNNVEKLDLKTIEYNLQNIDGVLQYELKNDYKLNYPLVKKIIDIIGYTEINILYLENGFKGETMPIIEVIGKNNQVGYLLPMKKY